jgi:hypothetical protein
MNVFEFILYLGSWYLWGFGVAFGLIFLGNLTLKAK